MLSRRKFLEEKELSAYRDSLAELREDFVQRYGTTPQIFRAPGRVNLIGEHTDYNDGFVMPVAIQFYAYVAIAPRLEQRIRVHSRNFGESAEFSLAENGEGPKGHWSDYVRGVARVLRGYGIPVSGADMMIGSEVPVGSGLSSSAAIEVASVLALLSVADRKLSPIEIARACQKAEHEYVGSMCGIMDQFIACFGRAGQAVLLDCRSLTYEFLAADKAVRIVICNTGVKHEHASSGYNRRRADCYAGVSAIKAHRMPTISALRDVTSKSLEDCKDCLPQTVYRRCRHVVTENERVTRAAKVLKSHDMETFGMLMYDSHLSLRDDYEVSSKELDLMVEIARTVPGVYGARMTGGGFGGCTVNLVRADATEEFIATVKQEYAGATTITPAVYVCVAAQGAGPAMDKEPRPDN
jgi:galactokinase